MQSTSFFSLMLKMAIFGVNTMDQTNQVMLGIQVIFDKRMLLKGKIYEKQRIEIHVIILKAYVLFTMQA